MRKKRTTGSGEDLNFWQPASDMFSALLLIMVLVILLLGLYIVYIPENDQPDPWDGDTYANNPNDWGGGAEKTTATPEPTPFIWFPGYGGGDDGGGYIYTGMSPTPSVSPSPTPTPVVDGGHGGHGGGDGGGEGAEDRLEPGMKSAVYVMLVDAETDRTIKEAHVEFELYGEDSALQVLNTYYPERLSYRFFETTESGTFYLPEKIKAGRYELHELTEPEGYDASDNIPFEVASVFDWSDPLVVRVPVYPSRNVIRISMADEETGLGIGGGSFDVIASEDVITPDGTLRYRRGQVVSEIVCDENGYGESDEVYLGSYLLRQRDIPPYYAGLTEDLEVAVEKKTKVLPGLNAISCARTRINVTVTDELYANTGVSNASFVVTSDRSEPIEMTTDASGRFTIDTLEKGTIYRIHQTASAKGYQPDRTDQTVAVTASGWIDESTSLDVSFTNRMIRVFIGLTDEASSIQIPGVNLALYDSAGTMIRTWTTSGSMQSFTDLTPGRYYLIKDGDDSARYEISVNDQAEIQNINIYSSYVLHYVAMGAAAFAVVGALTGVILLIRKRRRR